MVEGKVGSPYRKILEELDRGASVTFKGKKMLDMDRLEMMEAINWLTRENLKLMAERDEAVINGQKA